MIPAFVAAGTPASERRVFDALQRASGGAEWVVLHSLAFSSAWTGEYGEIDFVVIVPRQGIVCIEVKGGKVRHENGVWITRRQDGSGEERLKRSPFRQAQQGMWKLKQAIERKFGPNSAEARCPIGWLAILPDIACPPVTPEFTRQEVIDELDLQRDISEKIKACPSLAQLAKRDDLIAPQPGTCKRIIDFLRPDFERVELVTTSIWDTEQRIQSLTEEQFGVLDAVADNARCVIRGPAGTGKTNLAIESARRLSAAGKRVMLACFNRNLGHWLSERVATIDSRIVAGHMHGLLRDRIRRSSVAGDLPLHGDAEASELYDRLYFELGALAIYDIGERFDAVLIDEVQDMDGMRLADVVRAWSDGVSGARVILFGDFARQALYGRSSGGYEALLTAFPGIPVFRLGINCRNTKRIALQTDLMSGFAGSKVKDEQPVGEPVEVFFASDDATAKRVDQLVTALRRAGYRAADVVVLGARRRENSSLARLSSIGGWRLRELATAGVDDLAYSTIHSFKGLERPVVIVVDAGSADTAETDSLLYVAMSRARLRLFVICREEARAVIETRIVEGISAMRSDS